MFRSKLRIVRLDVSLVMVVLLMASLPGICQPNFWKRVDAKFLTSDGRKLSDFVPSSAYFIDKSFGWAVGRKTAGKLGLQAPLESLRSSPMFSSSPTAKVGLLEVRLREPTKLSGLSHILPTEG